MIDGRTNAATLRLALDEQHLHVPVPTRALALVHLASHVFDVPGGGRLGIGSQQMDMVVVAFGGSRERRCDEANQGGREQ